MQVAGTRVFDEKKEESTKILHDTQSKIEKSIQLLGYINERLTKLEEEKEDLHEYQKWDKMRRSHFFILYIFVCENLSIYIAKKLSGAV